MTQQRAIATRLAMVSRRLVRLAMTGMVMLHVPGEHLSTMFRTQGGNAWRDMRGNEVLGNARSERDQGHGGHRQPDHESSL